MDAIFGMVVLDIRVMMLVPLNFLLMAQWSYAAFIVEWKTGNINTGLLNNRVYIIYSTIIDGESVLEQVMPFRQTGYVINIFYDVYHIQMS